MHLKYPNSDTYTGTASTADEAGTPVLIINPRLNINARIIEILEDYKSRFDYFRPIKIK